MTLCKHLRRKIRRYIRGTFALTPSRSEPVALPLAGTGKDLATGFYFVRVGSPQLDQATDVQGSTDRKYLVAASHLNLTFKIGATDALLWATDLRTNEPVSASFTIYDNSEIPVVSGQTDAQGLWYGEFSPQEKPGQTYTALLSEPGLEDFGVAQSSWSSGVSPWDFGISLQSRPPEPETYLYTDRPIYRPGQTSLLPWRGAAGLQRPLYAAGVSVRFTGVVRQQRAYDPDI